MIPGNGSLWDTIKFLVALPAALLVGAFRLVLDRLRRKS